MSDVKDYFKDGLTTEGMETPTYDNSPVPEGKYIGKIVNASAEINPESWSDGEHLKIEFEITSEQSKGRHLWKNITLVDDNADYVEWGKQDLMRLMSATEIGSLTSWDQLIGKQAGFTVSINKNGYNDMKRWTVAKDTKPQASEPVSEDSEKNPWDQ
jgi:hypothetical protein